MSLATGRGGCFATDSITVGGRKVGALYREPADGERDSGWRCFAGGDRQWHVDDPANPGLYGINTIAGHETEIVPLPDMPFGSAFVRGGPSGDFVEVDFEPPDG
jgi:hypothetical protein